MSKEVKINYNNTFATQHSRDYYRGASFHWSGEWMVGAHYLSDDYTIDYVVHGQVLLACAKSHLSTLDNEPKDFITDESGTVIGVVSTYWDFVLSGIVGKSPGIKIQDNYWYICKDTGVPEEQQVWENTGVKAKMELSDLTPEEIEILQRPGKEVVTEFINNTMTQSTGDNPEKIMSQKATTDALNTKASKSELSAAVENEVLRANETYQPKGDYATNTKVDNLQDEVDDFEDAVDEAFGAVSEALDTLQDNIDGVADSIPTKVSELENDSRYQTKTDLDNALNPIKDVIPAEATVGNKLADKNFVTVSIETAKAAFKGVSASGLTEEQFLAWANGLTTNENDYVFWNTVDSNGNAILKRYVRSDSSWVYEYTLSNNSFSTSEWNAIQSGITSELVSKLTNIEAGAQVNILEGVQVSGIDLAITNKKVNVDLTPITNVIPTQASSSNQLADKNFVNSSIATSTATFQGTSAAGLTQAQFEAWLETLAADDNDYVYWNTVDSVGNVVFKRYKYNGTAWVYEYDLNNSSFTSTEWAAIQSGVTAELVTKLIALPTNADLTAALNNKVDKVTGKQLSTEDYTTEEKQKLTGIATGAEVNVQPDWNVTDTSSDAFIKNKPQNLVQDANYVHTDNNYTTTEKNKLSGIASNAQVNVLEGVQVNGADLAITDKKVNIDLSGKVDKETGKGLSTNDYTTSEKNKLSDIESGAQVNKIEHIQINGTEQTISNKTVNLPAYPTTLPASDVSAWAKASTKPSYNFSEIGGTVADSQLPDTISSDITGTAMGLKTEKLTGQEFVYRATPNTIKAKSLSLDRIYGKTLAWNQYVNAETSTFSECTITKNTNGTYTVSGSGTTARFKTLTSVQFGAIGHKLLYRFHILSGTGIAIYDTGNVNAAGGYVTTDKELIYTQGALSTFTLYRSANVADDATFSLVVFDITLMFGAGNEPSTVAEFKALFPNSYYPYNAGTLISNDAEAIETVGRNVWDEEWELDSLTSTDGSKTSSTTQIRSKNYIPVLPNTTYYRKNPYSDNGAGHLNRAAFYDANKQYLGGGSTGGWIAFDENGTFTTPANAAYMLFYVDATTYANNICINLSDSNFNGQYEPYHKSTLPLNLDDFWVKDSQGNLVHITGGLKSAGSACDEIVGNKYVKRVGSVDLGNDLEWAKQESETRGIVYRANLLDAKSTGCGICDKYIITTQVNDITISADKIGVIAPLFTSKIQINIKDSAYSDAATFKTAMNGVMLNYELATPIEYELVSPIYPSVKCGTTEARVSPNADGISAPFRADMTYSVADYIEYADRAGALVKGASVDLTDIAARGELSGDAFKAIAEHIAELTSRVEVLEAGVGTVDTLSSTSVDSANGYYINGDKTVIIGSGAPTMVPAFAGQFYINTSGPALYYAVNNSATTDWKQA